MLFLTQKIDGNIIFTDYWKVLVLTFSEMGNTVSFWAKKVDGKMIFTDYWKFLFWTFRWWKIRSFFESRSWWKDDIYWLLRSSCFDLSEMGNTVFSEPKVDGKTIFTDYWTFLFWTFRWWEIRSFLSQEVDWKMIFTGYWEVLVLNFSVMGNPVFFSVKKLVERWYLLGFFEVSIIFKDLRNMVFRAVSHDTLEN